MSGSPGEKGGGRCREKGKEGAESGIPKVAGCGRNKKKITHHCAIV